MLSDEELKRIFGSLLTDIMGPEASMLKPDELAQAVDETLAEEGEWGQHFLEFGRRVAAAATERAAEECRDIAAGYENLSANCPEHSTPADIHRAHGAKECEQTIRKGADHDD